MNEIIKLIQQLINGVGGVDVLCKAMVWKWWKESDIQDERDFDSAIDECCRCYLKAEPIIKILRSVSNENPTNIKS